MITHTLDIEDDYDFDLIGISSHERDYRLVWSLNRMMGWKMIRHTDITVEGKRGISSHARFIYVHPMDQTVVTLIDNKTPHGYFLPEVVQFDYLLKIEGSNFEQDDGFYRKLRSTPFILTAFPLAIDKLRSKQNLIYENG